MVKHYEQILESHNALGDCLRAARTFIPSPIATDVAHAAIAKATGAAKEGK